jgi:hypothetical protein
VRLPSKEQEKGAALVEVGLVLPFLILLAIGLSEIGFLVLDFMAVSSSAREGARIGASAADYDSGTEDADDLILRGVEQAACSMPYGSLREVWVYEANASGGVANASSTLNRYVPGSGGLNCSSSGPTGLVCSNGCPWAPSSRSTQLGSLQNLGVRVDFRHNGITGLFPMPTVDWSERAIMRIQPNTKDF